jgi:hypothetical protein
LFFGAFSFAGQWKLFLVFDDILQGKNRKLLAFLILYTPSIWFWGSGILKDSVCIGAAGFILHILYNLFVKKRFSVFNLLSLVFFLFIVYTIKSYIAFILFLSLGIMLAFMFVNAFKNIILKIALFMVSILVMLVILVSIDFTEEIKTISEETVLQVKSYKQNYENIQEQDENSLAGFEAAEIDPSATSILLKSPGMIFTTLFRPFIWEVRKPIMLFSALESLFLFLCTIYLFYKVGIFRFFRIIAGNRYTIFCLAISLLFALVIGLTTFNFGTMGRYKIILMPFYYFMLLFVYSSSVNNKAPATSRASAL